MIIEDVQLKHNLTDKETADLARTQAQSLDKLRTAKTELESVKKDYAGRIALAEAEIQAVSAKVHTGWELRNIRCLLLDERPEGYRLVVRTDNAHIVKRRILEPHERQLNLTTEQPRPLSFSVILPVDDEAWEADFYEAALYDDEVAVLKDIPGLQFKPVQRHARQITDGKDGKKK